MQRRFAHMQQDVRRRTFALGRRGERPVAFRAPYGVAKEIAGVLPGAVVAAGGVTCSWDAANALSRMLAIAPPAQPALVPDYPGLERYRALGFPTVLRSYQKEAVAFLATRAYALLGDPPRSGKSAVGVAASVLVDSKRTLVVAPALAKWVWADEIAKWAKDAQVIVLDGRAATEARAICHACRGRGKTESADGPAPCEVCRAGGKSLGYRVFRPRVPAWVEYVRLAWATRLKSDTLAQLSAAEPADTTLRGEAAVALKKAVAAADKARKSIERASADVPAPGAAEHIITEREFAAAEKVAADARQQAQHEIRSEIERHEYVYVLVNYDLLTAQADKDARGMTYIREDLAGWAPFLASIRFGLALCDESHGLRGTRSGKKGASRRDRTKMALSNIEQVWFLTATPIFGFQRDLYGQLDILTGGLFGGKPSAFELRYCGGRMGTYGWMADDATNTEELMERLSLIMIKRPRSVILPHMPPKTRQVINIEADKLPKTATVAAALKVAKKSSIADALTATASLKIDTVIENVLQEMATGEKVIIFTQRRPNAQLVLDSLQAAIANRTNTTRMRAVNAKVWLAWGEQDPKTRFEFARDFRDHNGAAAFIATIDSVQVAVSLLGATSVHFVDLHHSPAALLQAEDRGYEPNATGYTIVYYVVKDTVDEAVIETLLPKMRLVDAAMKEKDAGDFHATFHQQAEEESVVEIWQRLTAHIRHETEGI